MSAIDLNADVAEGTGIEPLLAPHCTSWNLCCGYHAGSTAEIQSALQLAKQYGISIGAHPGHPDRANFGRIPHPISAPELTHLLETQVGHLKQLADSAGLSLTHLKLHGALYHQASAVSDLARATVDFARKHHLIVFGLPGSILEQKCSNLAPFAGEGFADRAMGPDGKLLPRDQPGSVLHDPIQAANQALILARTGRYQTLCTHGDSPGAAQMLEQVKNTLIAGGFTIRAPKPDIPGGSGHG